MSKLSRCFGLLTTITNGPDSGEGLAMHVGECLRKGETLSILMESLQRMTNRNVAEVQRTLDQVLECHNNVAGVSPHVALSTMTLNSWKVPRCFQP